MLTYSRVELIDADGQPIHRRFPRVNRLDGRCALSLLVDNCVTGHACLIHRDLLTETLPFPDGLLAHDHWLALVAAASGRMQAGQQVLSQYRMHSSNALLSGTRSQRTTAISAKAAGKLERQMGLCESLLAKNILSADERELLTTFVRLLAGNRRSIYNRALAISLRRNADRFLRLYDDPVRARRKLCRGIAAVSAPGRARRAGIRGAAHRAKHDPRKGARAEPGGNPTMSDSLLTVIFVSYNSFDTLTNCLGAWLGNPSVRIIVVDNASRDGSAQKIREHYPAVEVLAQQINLGYGRAANRALREVTTPYSLLLNPDIMARESDALALVERMRTLGDDVAVLAPAVRERDYTRTGIVRKPWVIGAAMLFNMRALEAVGLFDENIFLFSEETDLCHRINRQGLAICLDSDLYIRHLSKQSSAPNAAVE